MPFSFKIFSVNFNSNVRRFCKVNSWKCFTNTMPVYDLNSKFELEKYWSVIEKEEKLKNLDDVEIKRKKMYILSMFPYPSGHLHMGHMRVYTVADVLSRYFRLLDKNVIFPMGWDSFGLPAENAAFERGFDPQSWTKKNISEMRQQLDEHMSLSIDWDREISTCDPDYYRWTQWLFCRLYEKNNAYQRTALVNWDPVDCTVLADELVDNNGRSWRSGAVVEKKPLKQWFIRTTALSESLIEGLETVSNGQWRNVLDSQRGWIGNLEGVYVEMDLIDTIKHTTMERLPVFTDSPAAVLSDFVGFVEINEDSVWWNFGGSNKTLDQKLLPNSNTIEIHPNLAVKHPISGRIIPVVKRSNLKFNEEECLSARFGLPILHLQDARTAAKLNIKNLSSVTVGAFNRIKNSPWICSEGMTLNTNFESILSEKSRQTLQELGRGGFLCSKLRTDWLISRQRYWGTPIPLIYCPNCGPVLVPDDQLPVVLPPFSECQMKKISSDSVSPLAHAENWVKTCCPKCGNVDCRRETDTMDTFVDSSWYFLRFLDPTNQKSMVSQEIAKELMPVDIYLGGIEHAIRHLFYARFVSHFLHFHTDIRLPFGPEPFTHFLPIGLVLGKTYKTKSGKHVPQQDVKYEGSKPIHIDSNEPLIEFWDKMSKSKHNGVSPEVVVAKYGIDSTRLFLLSNTGPDKNRMWQENDTVNGTLNWERKIWNIIKTRVDAPVNDITQFSGTDPFLNETEFISSYPSIIVNILNEYEKHFTISVIISRLQKLLTNLNRISASKKYLNSLLFNRILLDYIVLLYPLSPLLSCELWTQLTDSIHKLEPIFIATSEEYEKICGCWNYNLRQPVWNQTILSLSNLVISISQNESQKRLRSND